MGNCFTTTQSIRKKTARVIDGRGNSSQVHLPAKAGELMVQDPSHVVCPVDDLRRTRRVPAMKADDQLLPGKLYLLLPTSRANCRVTEAEMARIEAACNCIRRKKNRRRAGAKVLLATTGELREEGEDRESQDLGRKSFLGLPAPGCRLGDYRPNWTPALEPISELL